MRQIYLVAVLALCLGVARADSIPVTSLTQGTVTLSNFNIGGFDSVFSFSNGSGVNIGGIDAGFSGLTLIGGGQTGNPFLNIGLNLETSNVNGTTLFLFGVVTITGADFVLPTSGTTFSTTMPVLFSGSFKSCEGGFGPINGGCNPPAPTYLGQFNISGPGTVSLSFLGVPLQDGRVVWELSGGTYTLNTVPEPATIALFGTGALAILGRKRLRRVR